MPDETTTELIRRLLEEGLRKRLRVHRNRNSPLEVVKKEIVQFLGELHLTGVLKELPGFRLASITKDERNRQFHVEFTMDPEGSD